MNDNPLISILIPAYNVEQYISKCLESVCAQTYENIQIIVVDDGSTDSTGTICDMIAQNDARVEVYHTVNGGLVAARKRGLFHAKGDYIGFVDGDDYVEKEMYEKLLCNLIATKADFVHSCYMEEFKEISTSRILVSDCVIELHDDSDRVNVLTKYIWKRENKQQITPSIWSKLFKRNFIMRCYDKVPNEQQYGEDVLCLYHSLLTAKKVSLISEAYYHYIVREQSLSHVSYQTRLMKEISLSHYIIKAFETYSFYNGIREVLCNHLRKNLMIFTEDEQYQWLSVPYFCYGNIERLRGKKIVLYGAGQVGKDYYRQIRRYMDISIVAWTDKKWQSVNIDYANIKSIERIEWAKCEFVLIAIDNEEIAKNVMKELRQMGVRKEMILWEKPAKLQ